MAVATSLLRLGSKATTDVGAHGMTKSALPVVGFCVVGCQGETNTVANFSQDVVAKAREFDRESAALKTRVHHLAKSLGLTSKETIEALGHAGIVVKSAAPLIKISSTRC